MIARGQDAIVHLLLEYGADLDARTDGYGHKTPLHIAAGRGNGRGAQILLDNGANLSALDHWGSSPLHCWAWNSSDHAVDESSNLSDEMAQRLLKIGVKPDARNGIAGTARVLLSYGANVDACDKRSMATPLHIAARSGNYKHAQLLLLHGANPNATDCHGETTLFWAAGVSDNEHVVQLLLSHGAKIDARGRDGGTLLHKAARGGIASTTRFLLAHHANVDALDKFGRTPLRVAMLAGHAEVITQLASFRANRQNNREREMIPPRSTDAIDEAISLWSPKNNRSDPNEMTSLGAEPNSMSRELCTTLPHPQSPRPDYPLLFRTPIVDGCPTLNDPNHGPRPVLSKSHTTIPHPRPSPPDSSFPLYPATGIIGGRAKKDPFAGTYMAYQPPLPQGWPAISPAMGR